MTLHIKDKKLILPKLYFGLYYITRKKTKVQDPVLLPDLGDPNKPDPDPQHWFVGPGFKLLTLKVPRLFTLQVKVTSRSFGTDVLEILFVNTGFLRWEESSLSIIYTK